MIYIAIAVLILMLSLLITRKNKNASFEDGEYPLSCYPASDELPYSARPLLSRNEFAFYQCLKEECTPLDIQICPKTRLEDIIHVSCSDQKERNKYRGYIKSRHFDFILCDSQMNTLCIIELDDSSHNTARAQRIDQFKDDICEKIDIQLFRVITGCNYQAAAREILQHVCEHFIE